MPREDYDHRMPTEFSAQRVPEFSKGELREFFPEVKGNKAPSTRRARKKKQLQMSKMLAATTVLSVGVVVTAAANTPASPTPVPVLPPAVELVLPKVAAVQVLDFTPSTFVLQPTDTDSTAGYYSTPSYTVAFPFELGDGTPTRVEITGEKVANPYWGSPDTLPTTESLSLSISAEKLTKTEEGVLAKYLVEDITFDYTLTATLYYEIQDPNTMAVEEKSVATEPFLAGLSYFLSAETESTNVVEYVIEGDIIHCTATFYEVRAGAFELRGESVYVEWNDPTAEYGYDSREETVELLKTEEGTFTYTFDVPLLSGVEVIEIFISLNGDCYFGEEKMEYSSGTFAKTEILLT